MTKIEMMKVMQELEYILSTVVQRGFAHDDLVRRQACGIVARGISEAIERYEAEIQKMPPWEE